MSAVTVSVPVAFALRARSALDLLHALAAATAFALPMPAALIVLAGTAASALAMRSTLLLSARAASGALALHADGSLSLAGDRSPALQCAVTGHRILGEGAVIIALRDLRSGRSRSLVLLAGDQSAATLRAVRVWLRWCQPDVVHPDADPVRLRDRADQLMIPVKKRLRALNLMTGSRSHRVDPAIPVVAPSGSPSVSATAIRAASASLSPSPAVRGEGGGR